MKNNWPELTPQTMPCHDKLFGMSAIYLADQKVKLLLGDYLYIKEGVIEKSNILTATHFIRKLEGTISSVPKRITLESLSTNLIETIDL